MAKMISEIVDALGSKASSDEQPATKPDIARLERDQLIIKWMLGVVTVAVLIPLITPFFS